MDLELGRRDVVVPDWRILADQRINLIRKKFYNQTDLTLPERLV